MKHLFFISLLFLVGVGGSAQNWIDSLKILPQNPDTADIVKVICYTYFPTSHCILDSSTIITSNFEISIYACYDIGEATMPCSSIDTIIIGTLSSGNYVLTYNVKRDCDTINVSDSFNFTVIAPTILPEEIKNNFWLPNVFSPNGDGNNDVLYLRGSNIQDITFTVYDRWGDKVFESTAQNDGWKGEGYNSGVFVYRVNGTYIDGTSFEKKGNVTLVR